MKVKIIMSLIALFVIIVLGLMTGGIVVSFRNSSEVSNAKGEELKVACTSDWYKNSSLDNLPAQCLQFYSQSVN